MYFYNEAGDVFDGGVLVSNAFLLQLRGSDGAAYFDLAGSGSGSGGSGGMVPHAETHHSGGGDDIDIAALAGTLAKAQQHAQTMYLDAPAQTLTNGLAWTGVTGDKLSLYEDRLGLSTMYGFGVESSTLYSKSPTQHRWYIGTNADGGTSSKMTLTSTLLALYVPTLSVVDGTVYAASPTGTSTTFDSRLTTDSNYRWRMRANGQQLLSDGAGLLYYSITPTAATGLSTAHASYSAGVVAQNMGVGTSSNSYAAIMISRAVFGASAGRYGMYLNTSATYDALMTTYRALWIDSTITEHASLTSLSEFGGIRIGAPSKGASLTNITTQYGIRIDAQTMAGLSNNVNAIHQVGASDFNVFAGNMAIGSGIGTSIAFRIQKTLADASSASQYGQFTDITVGTGATTAARAAYFRITLQNTAVVYSTTVAIYVAAAIKGASATATNVYGIYIEDQTVGGTNYGLNSSGITNFNFLAGRTGIGTGANAASGTVLSVRGSVQTVGATQYGLAVNPTLANDATTMMLGGSITFTGSNTGTYVTAAGRVLSVGAATKGTNQTITTLYGLYLETQTAGGTNYTLYAAGGNSRILGTLLVGSSGTLDPSLVFQVESTTGFLRTPTMTTVQRNAVASPPNGSELYDTTLHRKTIRVNGAWHTLVAQESTNIYTGANTYQGSIDFTKTGVGFGVAPGNAGYYMCSPTGTPGTDGWYITSDTTGEMQWFHDNGSAYITIASTGIVSMDSINIATAFGLGLTPIGRMAAIAAPTGGATVDTEARAAINAIRTVLSAAMGGFGFTA